MYVTKLILRNWRNFRSVDVDLDLRVFVAGPNASGKSNLLDVFVFLKDLAKPGGGLQNAVTERGGISKLRCLAARQYPDVEIEVHVADNGKEWSYAIGIKQEARGYRQPYLAYERVAFGSRTLLSRPDELDLKDRLRLTQTHLEQINANAEFRELGRFFESITYLHLVPQLLRHPEAFSGPGIPGDPYGRSFLEKVARTSDGTLRLIGLLWSLLEGDSTLLLEEPELSLNAGIVRKLPQLMYRIQKQKRRQIMLSTHSPDLLSDAGIGGEEVLLLSPGEEGTKVELASSIDEVKDLLEGGLTIADAALPRTVPSGISQLDLFE